MRCGVESSGGGREARVRRVGDRAPLRHRARVAKLDDARLERQHHHLLREGGGGN